MSDESDDKVYDPTTPDELLALSKHLAGDPSLAHIFDRVGLHNPFDRKTDEYRQVIASRDAFIPSLYDRPCSNLNIFLAEALARRIYSKAIWSDEEAISYLSDRIRNCTYESASTAPLESEIQDIMRNLSTSKFFKQFERCRRKKDEIRGKDIDPYEGLEPFIFEQMWTYGLGGRGTILQRIVLSILSQFWFGAVPDLSPATVAYLLAEPGERIFLRDDDFPRKG